MEKKEIKDSIKQFGKDLEKAFEKKKYIVFLCGPTLDRADEDDAAKLRLRLKTELEGEDFEVVLGLEDLRTRYAGMAHENELEFISNYSNSVLLIASSVGSFCELGLFSYHHVRENARHTDFILILDEKYKNDFSYLNEGPAKAIENFGKLIHGNFSNFDTQPIIDRLRTRRNVWFTDPKGKKESS